MKLVYVAYGKLGDRCSPSLFALKSIKCFFFYYTGLVLALIGKFLSSGPLQANASISIGALLSNYPGDIVLANVQFPDPHFKKKHHKRRIVQAELVSRSPTLLPTFHPTLI